MGAVHDRTERIEALGWTPANAAREDVRRCNLCGGERLVEVARSDRYAFDQRAVLCARCGLGFLAPRLTAQEYAGFYERIYRPLVSAYHGRTIDAVTVQDDQHGYAAELVAFLRASLPSAPGSILDVGGSTGLVAGAVRDALGGAITVLDPAPDELAVAAAAGMETIEGFAEDLDAAGRTWDLVLLCQTIDHLLDVRATLATLRAATSPRGHAFVDVLDLGYAVAAKGTIEGAVKVDHPFYLTRDTAAGYFDQAGFAVVAERLSDDGHWGFLLAPAEPADPDLARLGAAADRMLAEIWRRRAGG
jgi:SAM-dependent methyltransferase